MSPTTAESSRHMVDFFRIPNHWPGQGDLLQWCQNMTPGVGALLLLGGVVYLMFGYYAFKGLVTLNAGFVGGVLGAIVGDKFGVTGVGALVGGVLMAATAWPLMKYAVALMGGIFGALLGTSLWRAFNLDPNLAWAGAMVGLVLMGMLSFVLFRGSIMMYTSLQGAVMLILGTLGLAFKYHEIAPQLSQHMTVKPFLLPLSIFVPAVLGMIYQQHNYPAVEAGKKK